MSLPDAKTVALQHLSDQVARLKIDIDRVTDLVEKIIKETA